MNKVKNYFKRLYDIIMKPEMKVLPGQLAFFLFLSLVPIITLVIYTGMILSIGTDSVAVFVSKVFPTDVSNILVPYVNDVGIDFILEREKKTTCGYIGFQLGFQRNNIYNNLLQ